MKKLSQPIRRQDTKKEGVIRENVSKRKNQIAVLQIFDRSLLKVKFCILLSNHRKSRAAAVVAYKKNA